MCLIKEYIPNSIRYKFKDDIGDDGALAFADVLMTDNRTLEALGIQHNNNIGPTGSKALQNVIASKPFFHSVL